MSLFRSSAGAEQGRGRSLRFSLYFSSVLLGSATLTLPLTGAHLGFVPVILAILLVGALATALYVGFARTLAYNIDRMADTTAALISRSAGGLGVNLRSLARSS